MADYRNIRDELRPLLDKYGFTETIDSGKIILKFGNTFCRLWFFNDGIILVFPQWESKVWFSLDSFVQDIDKPAWDLLVSETARNGHGNWFPPIALELLDKYVGDIFKGDFSLEQSIVAKAFKSGLQDLR